MAETTVEDRVISNLLDQIEELKDENYDLQLKNMPVCVTGASGYIGSMLTQMLCEAGYEVRGTVRSTANAEKVAHLEGLCPSNPVKLYESDLLSEGSFNEAVAGCGVVFHTASPFQTQVEDGQRDLVDPAVKGTKNVLGACIQAGTVAAAPPHRRTAAPPPAAPPARARAGKRYRAFSFSFRKAPSSRCGS